MTVYDAIVLRLSEKRGGNILPTKVIKTVSKFLAEVVGLEDAKDFSLLDLPSVVDEAWEKSESEKAPEFVKRKVARWVNNDPGEKMGEETPRSWCPPRKKLKTSRRSAAQAAATHAGSRRSRQTRSR